MVEEEAEVSNESSLKVVVAVAASGSDEDVVHKRRHRWDHQVSVLAAQVR